VKPPVVALAGLLALGARAEPLRNWFDDPFFPAPRRSPAVPSRPARA